MIIVILNIIEVGYSKCINFIKLTKYINAYNTSRL